MATMLRSLGDRSLRSLFDFEGGLVGREVYVNEEIYQMELEQIFARCWLFLGHESQIPNPGDFVVTRMGEDQYGFILYHHVRENQTDDQVTVFMVEESQRRFPTLNQCSFDQGFHSPDNQVNLKRLLDHVILPKKGRLSKEQA